MINRVYDVAIIGAGASGLMLAANLDIRYSSGVVLEGTSYIGSKILMSGGGRCNITHGGSIKEFVNAYGDDGAKIRKCLYKHNNLELISWLEGVGVPTIEEEGRVFPASMKAKDVLDALVAEAASNTWQIESDAKVSALEKSEDGCWNIELKDRGWIAARNVVVASGGVTYPETGSDGSMLGIMKGLDITIREMRPALAPIFVKGYPYDELSGISVADVEITIIGNSTVSADAAMAGVPEENVADNCRREKKKTVRVRGDLLFTHEGFSGPAILNISKFAEKGRLMKIDYGKSLDELPKRMQRMLQERARGESGDVRTKALEGLLRADEFEIEGVSDRGMVTSGGVSLEEMDLSNMRCKRFEGLYIIGEALDVDGITGGYNLQMCWSTANSCADALREELQD